MADPANGITVNGTEIALLSSTLKITDNLRVSNDMECTVRYVSGDEPTQGDEIKAFWNSTNIFTGVIVRAIRRDEVSGNRILFDILAEDYFRNFRRVTVARVWKDYNLRNIMEDVVAEVDGVTLHPDQALGPSLTRIRSNYREANKTVRAVCDIAEYFYFVDEEKRFRAHAIDEIAAPSTLEDDGIAIGEIDYDIDDSEYVNRVRVVGDLRPGEEILDTFRGDGASRVFELTTEPFNTPVIRLNGVEQAASEEDTEAPWDAGPFNDLIEQRTSQTVLPAPTLHIVDFNGREVWEVANPTQPGNATNLGALPAAANALRAVTSHNGMLYVISGTALWEITDASSPGDATNKGTFPSGMNNPQGMTSHNGRLYMVNAVSAGATLWELASVDSPSSAVNKGTFPSGLAGLQGLASHEGNLYSVEATGSGDRLWEITDVDNPGGATNKGSFPISLSGPQGITSHDGALYITDSASPDELWRVDDPDSPGSAVDLGNLPSGLQTPNGITSHGDALTATYRGFDPIIAVEEDTAAITANGLYERSFHLGRITQAEADEQAKVHLRRYNHLVRHIGFRTLDLGFHTGQQLTANLTNPSVSSTFLIDYVRYRDIDGVTMVGEIRASDAEGDDDYTELWREDIPGEYVSGAPLYDENGDKVQREDRDVIYRLAGDTAPATPTGGLDDEDHLPSGWSRTAPDPTTSQNVWFTTRTLSYLFGVFQDATAWETPTIFDAKIAVTTRTEYVFRLATSTPSAPSGGTTTADHVPTGWSRNVFSPTTTQAVYRAGRVVTFHDGIFQSASVWGGVIEFAEMLPMTVDPMNPEASNTASITWAFSVEGPGRNTPFSYAWEIGSGTVGEILIEASGMVVLETNQATPLGPSGSGFG